MSDGTAAVAERPRTGSGGDDADVGYAARAPGLDLLGPVEDAAYTTPHWMVSLGGGRYFHISERLFEILRHCDGRTSYAEIARCVSRESRTRVDTERVRRLVTERLVPAGLAVMGGADDNTPVMRAPTPLMAIRHRARVLPYAVTAPFAQRLQHLFNPSVVAAGVTAAAVANVWLFTHADLAAAAKDLVFHPALLLVLLAADVPLRLFHELGHASAMRRAGVRHGDIGVALYVILPVYCTDVTHAYRLGRRDRIRVDCGGIYFDLLSMVGLYIAYQLTGSALLLPLMLLTAFDILREFTPLLRFDGYYMMADIIGVPEPLSLIGPLIRDRLSFTRKAQRRAPQLSRVAVLALWAYLGVILLFLLRPAALLGLLGGGAVFSELGASVVSLVQQLLVAWHSGSPAAVALSVIQLAFWMLIPLGLLLFSVSLLRLIGRGLAAAAARIRRRRATAPAPMENQPNAPEPGAAHLIGRSRATNGVAHTEDTAPMNGNGSHAADLPLLGDPPPKPSSSASEPSDPVEAALVAAAARQELELRHMGAVMQRLYEARLEGREREITALLQCLRETEHDRDALSGSLRDLEARFQRAVSDLRALGATAAKHAEHAEHAERQNGTGPDSEAPSTLLW